MMERKFNFKQKFESWRKLNSIFALRKLIKGHKNETCGIREHYQGKISPTASHVSSSLFPLAAYKSFMRKAFTIWQEKAKRSATLPLETARLDVS